MSTINTNQQSASNSQKVETHQKANGETFYAQPYSLDATGFYFSDLEDYQQKAEALRDRWGNPVEEFEIQYIDGDDAKLFDACGIDQASLGLWCEDIECLDDREKAALFYLVSVNGYSVRDALDKVDEVTLYDGYLKDAAEELFDECYAHSIPENIRFYIDYTKFARDAELGGDMHEFQFNGETYTCTNAACL